MKCQLIKIWLKSTHTRNNVLIAININASSDSAVVEWLRWMKSPQLIKRRKWSLMVMSTGVEAHCDDTNWTRKCPFGYSTWVKRTRPTPQVIWVDVYNSVIGYFSCCCVLKMNIWNCLTFTSNTPVIDCNGCTRQHLNVIFQHFPPDEARQSFSLIKTHGSESVCDCLLSFLISLCKQCCVRAISLFLDAGVNFSFMPRFPETNTKSDTLGVRSQTWEASNEDTFDETS